MNCTGLSTILDDYIDKALDQSEREKAEAHLRGCIACRQQLASLELLLNRAGALPRTLMPTRDLWPGIAAEIGFSGSAKSKSASPISALFRTWNNLRPVWRMAALAGVGLSLLIAALVFTRPSAPETPEAQVASKTDQNNEARAQSLAPQAGPTSDSAGTEQLGTAPSQVPSRPSTPSPGASVHTGTDKGIQTIYPSAVAPRPSQMPRGQRPYTIDQVLRIGGVAEIPLDGPAVAVGSSEVYVWGEDPSPGASRQLYLRRWVAGRLDTAQILQSTPAGIPSKTGIGVSPDGNPYVGIVRQSGLYARPAGEIIKVDFDRRESTTVWISNTLVPGNFAVSRQGYLYVAGVAEYKARAFTGYPSGNSRDLLHIVNPAGVETASLLPIPAASMSETAILILHAVFSVRANGNFVLSFGMPGLKYQNLASHDVKEYSPQGKIVRTYTFPELPENAAICSAIFDPEENLVVQVVESTPDTNSDGLRWANSYLIKKVRNASIQFRSLDFSSGEELLVGILGDGTLVVKYKPSGGQSLLRFRSP